MNPKSGYRFSEKIMLKQKDKAKCRINLSPFRFGGGRTLDHRSGGGPGPRPCRTPGVRAQQRLRIKQTQLFWRLQARAKRRCISLRLLQGCHNWDHDGLADAQSDR
jgi:hypothetical protein